MSQEKVIQKTSFNEKVCWYWLISGTTLCLVTIVGIPFLLIWLPVGYFFCKRYLDRMECLLTEKALKVKKGVLTRVEKTIPLEKITDMGMVQGPIMRALDLQKLTVETAGQSGAGSLVSLTGIVGAEDFRELVLAQRDRTAQVTPKALPETSETPDSHVLLTEMRDTLLRIEALLQKKASSNNLS